MIAGSPTVTAGQTVTVGQTLGLVGSTGASTGPHLRLGITINGAFVDPYAWLKPTRTKRPCTLRRIELGSGCNRVTG